MKKYNARKGISILERNFQMGILKIAERNSGSNLLECIPKYYQHK